MTTKRESLKLDVELWSALTQLAERLGCEHDGKPSWRRLVYLIARGDLAVVVKNKHMVFVKRRSFANPHERAERDRLRQEKIRRAAGIRPCSESSHFSKPSSVSVSDSDDDLEALMRFNDVGEASMR